MLITTSAGGSRWRNGPDTRQTARVAHEDDDHEADETREQQSLPPDEPRCLRIERETRERDEQIGDEVDRPERVKGIGESGRLAR